MASAASSSSSAAVLGGCVAQDVRGFSFACCCLSRCSYTSPALSMLTLDLHARPASLTYVTSTGLCNLPTDSAVMDELDSFVVGWIPLQSGRYRAWMPRREPCVSCLATAAHDGASNAGRVVCASGIMAQQAAPVSSRSSSVCRSRRARGCPATGTTSRGSSGSAHTRRFFCGFSASSTGTSASLHKSF